MYVVIIPIPDGRTIIDVRHDKEEAIDFVKNIQRTMVEDGKKKPTGFVYKQGDYEEVN